jgi:putative Mg2+ transporter-C (MgtC) family protein
MIEIWTVYLTKLFLSLILGLVIGIEREHYHKPAGMRDVTLVTLGATFFTLISFKISEFVTANSLAVTSYDIGRVIAYLIVSIGFLGSGVIMQHKDKLEGITTAGTLWVSVAIGIFVGLGEYGLAIVCACFIYFVLKLKHIKFKITKKLKRRPHGKKKSRNY